MKYFFILIFLLFIGFVSVIPYWTGVVAQHQLPLFNKRLSNDIPLKFTEDRYEQGWFHSFAESTLTVDIPMFNEHPFIVQHTIDHGFLPAQSPNIQSVLLAHLPACAPKLLTLNTSFQVTGEGTSVVDISPCTLPIENGSIQWQTSQAETHFVRDFSKISGELQSSQIQVNSGQTQIMVQDMGIQYRLEQKFLSELAIMASALHIFDQISVKFDQFKIKIRTEKTPDYLTIIATSDTQKASVEAEPYGPAHLDFSIQHLHLDTLQNLQTTLRSLYGHTASSLQQSFLLANVLTQQVPTLLKHSPELVVSRLNFRPPAGEVISQLRVKVETFDNNVLFNPVMLTQMLAVQFKLSLPQAMLKQLAQLSFEYQGIIPTPDMIEQRTQYWLTEQFFIPSLKQPNHYQIELQSKTGVLQINEKKLLWEDILRR
jgi:uncharacterized protein YdgA (DUF945 family)